MHHAGGQEHQCHQLQHTLLPNIIEVHIEQSVYQHPNYSDVQPGHHLSDIGQSIDVCSFHLQENFLTFVCFHRFT